jgi:hypothetical protein
MADISIKFMLQDGQETALIREFATALGWIQGEVTAGAFAKKELASVIKNTIKEYRIRSAVDQARSAKIAEVETLEIS